MWCWKGKKVEEMRSSRNFSRAHGHGTSAKVPARFTAIRAEMPHSVPSKRSSGFRREDVVLFVLLRKITSEPTDRSLSVFFSTHEPPLGCASFQNLQAEANRVPPSGDQSYSWPQPTGSCRSTAYRMPLRLSVRLTTTSSTVGRIDTRTGRGDFIVVLDSPHRENEGDLIIAAQDFTPAKAAFLIRHSSGYLCAPITPSRAAALELPQMVGHNTDPNRTAYTITIDAAEGVTTGISATDRSVTCVKLADPQAKKETFRRPGHVVPLQAREGGVLARQGHTEAAIDFCRLAGKELVGVIAEIVEDGDAVEGKAELSSGLGMMRRDGCLAFAHKYGLKTVTIEDLVRYLEGHSKG